MPKNVLITGGAGFAGSHLYAEIMEKTNWNVVIIDALTYAGDIRRIEDNPHHNSYNENGRYKFIKYDISKPINGNIIKEIGQIDYIFHFAAETFVDRSIYDPSVFIYSNFVGTFNLLEYTRKFGNVVKLICVSTDEVYGVAQPGVYHNEECPLKPSNPYSATKAGADCLALSWHNTYGLPVIVVRSMNLFGPYQHPEKFIGSLIRSLSKGQPAIIHGTQEKVGVRGWLHVRNLAAALLFLLDHGAIGEVYNVSGHEMSVIDLAKFIANYADLELKIRYIDYNISRPGHDYRYALDDNKLKNTGFRYPLSFIKSLEETVDWYLNNLEWIEKDIFVSINKKNIRNYVDKENIR